MVHHHFFFFTCVETVAIRSSKNSRDHSPPAFLAVPLAHKTAAIEAFNLGQFLPMTRCLLWGASITIAQLYRTRVDDAEDG